VVFIKV